MVIERSREVILSFPHHVNNDVENYFYLYLDDAEVKMLQIAPWRRHFAEQNAHILLCLNCFDLGLWHFVTGNFRLPACLIHFLLCMFHFDSYLNEKPFRLYDTDG